MNEKDLNEQRRQDLGLRVALAKREQSRPQMPQGLNGLVMQRANKSPRHRNPWWAVAASVAAVCLLAYAVHEYHQPADVQNTMAEKQHTEDKQQNPQVAPIATAPGEVITRPKCSLPSTKSQLIAEAATKTIEKEETAAETVAEETIRLAEPGIAIQTPTNEAAPTAEYASVAISKDSAYKAPAMMEEFVEKMAGYCKAEVADLECLNNTGDSTRNRMYVIEDTKENEVFERLIQMAVWYDNNSPGYFLTFSHTQFLFQLHDPQLNLKYFVAAERINARRILLYSTHTPISTQFNMGCYLEFRDKLTNTIERRM